MANPRTAARTATQKRITPTDYLSPERYASHVRFAQDLVKAGRLPAAACAVLVATLAALDLNFIGEAA